MTKDKRLDYIESFLINVNKKFPNIRFRCEYEPINYTYIVETIPLSEFKNNEEYLKIEYEFTEEFESKYLGYALMFISSESITKINNPLFEIGYQAIDFKRRQAYFSFMSDYEIGYSPLEFNFSLAA